MRFLGEEKKERKKEKEKKAPRRGGVWGGAPVLKAVSTESTAEEKTFKRRDKGESQKKLNNPPVVSSATSFREPQVSNGFHCRVV